MGTTTLAEFERPDGPDEVELLQGALIRVPPPQRSHGEICQRLFKLLDAAVERLRRSAPETPLGKVHIEMGYLLPGSPATWLRPDVSPTHDGQPGERYYGGAPLSTRHATCT